MTTRAMPKPLSRKQHAIVDFASAAVELALARMLSSGPGARRFLTFSGANAALFGLLTRHELGLVKLVPMRAHLALDGVFAAAFLAAPWFPKDEDTTVRATLAALGVSGALAALLTDPDRA